MSDIREYFKHDREVRQKRKAAQRPQRIQEILDLEKKGYKVKEMTPYQFRINGQVDIYPTNAKYHIFKGNYRGHYKVGELEDFIETTLR